MEEELLASRLLADDLREDSMHLKRLFLDIRQDDPFVHSFNRTRQEDEGPAAPRSTTQTSAAPPAPGQPAIEAAGGD